MVPSGPLKKTEGRGFLFVYFQLFLYIVFVLRFFSTADPEYDCAYYCSEFETKISQKKIRTLWGTNLKFQDFEKSVHNILTARFFWNYRFFPQHFITMRFFIFCSEMRARVQGLKVWKACCFLLKVKFPFPSWLYPWCLLLFWMWDEA